MKDFKKGVIYYAPFKFLYGYGIPSHIGKFELDTIFTFILFVYWCFYNKNSLRLFPLKKSVIVICLAAFIYSCNPQFAITVLLDSLNPYLYLIMFFSVLEAEEDIKSFIKVVCIYILFLNGNAICELFGYNVIGNQLLTVMTPGTYWAVDAGKRASFIRLHSFVPHSIGYGVENMIFFAFFFMLYIYCQDLMKKKTAINYMIICLFGVLLSGSRSPLLGGVIILLPYIANKRIFNIQNLIFIFFASIFIVYFWGTYLSTMFDSLTSKENVDIGGASSWDMRLEQLEYSVYFWMRNFWFGNGHTFDIFQGGKFYSEIYGAESVWFPIMMKQGLVGIVSYLFVIIDSCVSVFKTNYKWQCVCMMLGWLVIDSATNLPGLNILLPLYFYIVYYKLGTNQILSENFHVLK